MSLWTRSERHQDILPWNPLSFLIQNIKNAVCRFSLVSQWTPLTVQLRFNFSQRTPFVVQLFLFLKFDYVFLLPIRERLYLLRHCFWQAGHAILSFVCFFFSCDEWWAPWGAMWTDSRITSLIFIVRLLFIYAFTLHRALLQLIEATNVARRSWTAGGKQSTTSERPSRSSVLRFVDRRSHVVPCEQRPIDLPI